VSEQETPGPATPRLEALREVERRVLWLATAIVHHANRVRPNPSGVKVGGHQASSASLVTIMTSLWFRHLRAVDRVSVKPHASPVLHAVNYLLGELDATYLTTLRELGGLQSYPSRAKDPDPVDYSTGSVGIGATAPIWGAIARRYVNSLNGPPDATPPADCPRQYCLVGDAELDEGAVWEAIMDPAVAELGEVTWIVPILVGTPSGVSLAPEGGAHQSVITPSIGLEQPGIVAYEPAFAIDAEWTLLACLSQLGHPGGCSAYLRLSTRPVDQSLAGVPDDPAARERRRRQVVAGAYPLRRTTATATGTGTGTSAGTGRPAVTIAAMGAVTPEALAAAARRPHGHRPRRPPAHPGLPRHDQPGPVGNPRRHGIRPVRIPGRRLPLPRHRHRLHSPRRPGRHRLARRPPGYQPRQARVRKSFSVFWASTSPTIYGPRAFGAFCQFADARDAPESPA
jgi:pyruvate dehydrogenase complex dehydrogenase (E1) component